MPQINADKFVHRKPAVSPKDSAEKQISEPESPVTALNFHSPEFNQTDDLNDFCSKGGLFETLDGVVTADMRHQMERRGRKVSVGEPATTTSASLNVEPITDDADSSEQVKTVTIISYGRTLIISADYDRALACGKQLAARGLICTIAMLTDAATETTFSPPAGLSLQVVNTVTVTGAFGRFSAMATVKGKQERLCSAAAKDPAVFDLVLDLRPTAAGYLPAGYYSPGNDSEEIACVMNELPEMKGKFAKPLFNVFFRNRCLHGRSRTSDCRLCLDVCPVNAIYSTDRDISINHDVCQGCGGCSLVCPADAIRMTQPSLTQTLTDLADMMADRCGGACQPPLIIASEETIDSGDVPQTAEKKEDADVLFSVEQIGHVSFPLLLTALICGAGKVAVLYGKLDPPQVVAAVERQIRMARFVLKGLGLPEELILSFAGISPDDVCQKARSLPASPAVLSDGLRLPAFSIYRDKRMLARLAVQHLYDQVAVREPRLAMPGGSPFGAVTINSAACTLCMACAVACPAGALVACGMEPRLEFVELRCHQCGLCSEVCPEGAIELEPRIFCELSAIEKPAVLREVEPFRCVECGAPFATQVMIDRLREKLKGHWMYANERQMRRLSMCSTCRTRDALTTEERSWTRR
ncbi:MAG: 4Fe-4S binding protein [Smithellaceae bacterium]